MAQQKVDVLVIGAGPGGYVAAIRAAQLGFSVACVDKRGVWGGTCLNVGCIPSKALLDSSYKYQFIKDHSQEHGIKSKDISFDLSTMMKRKEKIVSDLTKGIEFLFKKNKIQGIVGTASLTRDRQVSIKDAQGSIQTWEARHIILATGSESASLKGVEIDEKVILSSTGALNLSSVPSQLVIIGAGYIGLEMGSVWQRLGSQVTVVEFLDRIVPSMDLEIAQSLQKSLTKQGLTFKLQTKVGAVTKTKKGVELSLAAAAGGTTTEILSCDAVLMSVGRKPYTEGLALTEAGILLDERGFVKVDDHCRTNISNIYAIGDLVRGPMLAHKAEEEGVAVAEIIAGQSGHVAYDKIPGVIYTDPEVATVGKTEEELKSAGTPYKVGKFPFSANSRARTHGAIEGFVKVLAHGTTDRLLGVHIMGADAGTLIAEAVVAMEFGGSAEDLARICHAHPTLNEAVKEGAMACYANKALHI